jgi:hypothetical protein
LSGWLSGAPRPSALGCRSPPPGRAPPPPPPPFFHHARRAGNAIERGRCGPALTTQPGSHLPGCVANFYNAQRLLLGYGYAGRTATPGLRSARGALAFRLLNFDFRVQLCMLISRKPIPIAPRATYEHGSRVCAHYMRVSSRSEARATQDRDLLQA